MHAIHIAILSRKSKGLLLGIQSLKGVSNYDTYHQYEHGFVNRAEQP